MYWECLTNVRYVELYYPFIDDYQNRDEVEKRSFRSARSEAHWLKHWYRIIITYSGTNLTFQKDGFPALSGVASKIHNLLGYHYLAGLWREDLTRGLTWFRPSYPKDPISSIDLSEYRAPSWSWASQEGKNLYTIPLRALSTKSEDVRQCQLIDSTPLLFLRTGFYSNI
jgi:hypothetical protein